MGLYDRWLDFRDKCLTSPAFHGFAVKFPLTRPIVRKRQNEVFDVVSGFIYSQVLFALVELDVLHNPSLRNNGGLSLEQFSESTGLELDEAKRLAKAASALRLLEERNEKFRLGDLGAALSANPGALAMIRHHKYLYKDLEDPVSILKSGRQETHLSRYWDYARSDDPSSASADKVSEYSQLMGDSQKDVSNEVIAAVDFSKYSTLMDIGGGQGVFLNNIGEANPDLNLELFDLPEVVKRAESLQAAGHMDPRIVLHGGSFFDDDLPQGADLISLIRILHDHDDEPVLSILEAAHKALSDNGTLLIAEPMSTGGSAHKIADAYFNFYLYAMGSGRPRSPKELTKMLNQSGFSNVKYVQTRLPFVASVILAEK